jgi:predicted metalloendopeptidase
MLDLAGNWAVAAVWFVLAGLLGTARSAPAPAFGAWGLDVRGMDKSVEPGNDFFKYVNGTWDAQTHIPADKSYYGVDAVLADLAESQVHGILAAEPAGTAGPELADTQKIHGAYLAFMDEAHAQALGAAPIAPDLAMRCISSRRTAYAFGERLRANAASHS